MNTLQDAINALQQRGCKPVKSGDGYQAYCPIHEADGQGHKPSLTIKAGDTVPVVVHCHAGCDGTAILKALGINGTPHTGKRRIVATYPFQDANGIVVFEKVRLEPKDFRICHQPINGAGSVWKKPPLSSYPLYRLPDVQTAKADGRPIYFVEGEKDADRLTGLGLVATTNFEGASEKAKKPKWRPEYSDQLSGAARVILIPDNDEPGQAHMRNIARQLRGKVAELRWLDLPGLPTKGDVSDWLNQGHTVAELLALVEQSPVADSVITDPPSQEEPEERPRGPARPAKIRVVVGELPEATDQAEAALIQHGAALYQRSGYLCRISHQQAATVRGITRPGGAATISPLDRDSLLDRLNRFIHWEKWNEKKEDYKRCHAPAAIAQTLLARSGSWNFPPLIGVVSAPTLRPDGSILDQPGYDKATGLFFDAQNEVFPPIPADPSPEEGRAALQFIFDEVLSGFPFAAPHDRSAALSAIATACIRYSLSSSPMHTVNAPVMAAGKSLLADLTALISTGHPATVMSYTPDVDEMRKRVLSVLMQGDLVVNLDNIEDPLSSQTLCTVLTQESFTDRILGVNRMATAPTLCCWIATGNNLVVAGDLTTRIVPCNLDPQMEHPEEREFKRNLHEWIPVHRPRLIQMILIMLRAYIVAGKPKQPIKNFARFEDWSGLVRSALIWLGEADPLAGTAELNNADPVRRKLRALLIVWWTTFRTAGATSKEAVIRAQETQRDPQGDEERPAQALWDVLSEHFTDRRGEIRSQLIGEFIRKSARRVEVGARFENRGSSDNRQIWRVVIVDEKRFQNFLAIGLQGHEGHEGHC